MVVSGKMTLSLIQDAPRETPDRDLGKNKNNAIIILGKMYRTLYNMNLLFIYC